MYPSSIYFGLKVVPTWVLWGQSIYCLGTWTLRGRIQFRLWGFRVQGLEDLGLIVSGFWGFVAWGVGAVQGFGHRAEHHLVIHGLKGSLGLKNKKHKPQALNSEPLKGTHIDPFRGAPKGNLPSEAIFL